MENQKKTVQPISENGNDVKPLISGSLSKCPECLQPTTQNELDMFGGLCEECSGVFDE